MNRDPEFLRAAALTPDESIDLPGAAAEPREPPFASLPGMAAEVATLLGFADGGAVPLVLKRGESAAQRAESLLALRGEHIGRRIALMPLSGAETPWLVIGLLEGQPVRTTTLHPPQGPVDVQADGQHLLLQAREEMILRCGKSSVKLRADGRIEIRGDTIISEAVRANRVRGGSVELN